MQYFSPGGNEFVGDCMPFWHDGVFHLYYLLDEGHHSRRGGLGEHQWAHSATTDLVNWRHHPLALAITEEWEGSICTGSAFYHEGVFWAFYAVRRPNGTQFLHIAPSADGIHFDKQINGHTAAPPAGYDPHHFRDPVAFADPDGLVHVLITAMLTDHPVAGRGGCLAHLVSRDLTHWQFREPFIIPGLEGAPECPDYFHWNGWYYLIFSNHGVARYRMSREPFGPWERPAVDTFDGPMARVMKTAAFGPDRRLGVAFVPSLAEDRDDGAWLYAGSALFREIIQHPDGSLGSCFPAEMQPACGEPLPVALSPLTDGAEAAPDGMRLRAVGSLEACVADGVPENCRITVRFHGAAGGFGLCVRGDEALRSGYEIAVFPPERRVEIRRAGSSLIPQYGSRSIAAVGGLDGGAELDVYLYGDIIDVCVNGERCLVARFPQLHGTRLGVMCQDGDVQVKSLQVRPLLTVS